MPLPPDLPARFTARLCGVVHALLEHPILRGDRQIVREPAEADACLRFHAGLDREAGTAFLVDFPPISDSLPTAIGRVAATVTVEGTPRGIYDAASGAIAIDVDLVFRSRHVLARTSRVGVHLATETVIDEPELHVVGSPLHFTDASLVLAGTGRFRGGSLDGGTLWLGVACDLEEIQVEALAA